MDLAAQLRQRLNTRLTRIRRAAKEWVIEVAEDLEIEVVKNWPGVDRQEIHIYATGKSQGSWGRRKVDDLHMVVDNTARKKNGTLYSGYVNRGYTRLGGPESARSYIIRRKDAPYADVARDKVAAGARTRLLVKINRELG